MAGEDSMEHEPWVDEVSALLLVEPVAPTDNDTEHQRPCPDCGYDIHPGFQHGRQPQPEGASHSVCSLQRAMRWEHYNPPWKPPSHEWGQEGTCTRCSRTIPPYWRHYWPPCRACALWSVAAQALTFAFGLNGHPWLYWGVRPWCRDCNGVGFLACQPQDMSVLRKMGACATCGEYSFELIDTVHSHNVIEGSGRHVYGEQPDHEVKVEPQPLVGAVANYLDHAEASRG